MAAYTNQIVPFNFEGAAVRVADCDGALWFVLADLCKVLEIGNPSQVVSRLDRDEKATLTNSEGQPGKGAQQFTIINESGLYRLIMVSRKPAAARFRRWVTGEVLPSIRRTGSYGTSGFASLLLSGAGKPYGWDIWPAVARYAAMGLEVKKTS